MRINTLLHKRVNRRFVFVCVCSLLCTIAYTQNEFTPRINIPTSPEAALLGRFGDIPIGYYTGTADVSIPLYTIKEGTVEVPLTLRYHGSGIRVDEQATWVGLGWELMPEGAITQEVRGKSDEEDRYGITCDDPDYPKFQQRYSFMTDDMYMFLPQWGRVTAPNECLISHITDPPPTSPWDNGYQDPYCALDQLQRGFGQPDIYSYSFNGQSGKFYINPYTHQIVVTEKNDQVYFEKIADTLIRATTLDGTVYNFGAVETASGGIYGEYVGKTYKMSSIELLNGRSVSFSYTTNSYMEENLAQSAEINGFSGIPVTTNYTATYHTKKTLVKITSSDAVVDFNLSSRDDINVASTDNLQRVSSIDITSRLNNRKIKTFQFTQSYFPYDYTGVVPTTYVNSKPDAFGKRLKLDAVQEIGYDDAGVQVTTKPPYQLEYDMSVTMPMKISFAKDFWGYYNGENNATTLPNLDYFDYFNQSDYASINETLAYPYTGANRYTNNAKAGAYMLKKIQYPTGGYTEFEYEPNSFTNQFIPDKSQPIYKSYYIEDNPVNSTPVATFKLSNTTNIHFENNIRNGVGNPNGLAPLTYSDMQGCYINFSKTSIVNGNPVTTTIKQWDLTTVLGYDFDNNGGQYWSENLRIAYDPDPTVTYKVTVYYPDNLGSPLYLGAAAVTSYISFYDNTGVDVSVSRQGGMRTRSIKNYTEAGVLASHKQYAYYEGKLLNRFRPLQVYQANQLDYSVVTDGNSFEYISFYKKITVSGNDFGTTGGNPIGYGRVEETEMVNGAATAGKKVFYYYNQENKTQQGCPYIPDLQNGLLLKEEVYDNMNIKQQQKTYNYTGIYPFPDRFICINLVRLATGSEVPCDNFTYPSPVTIQYYDNSGPYLSSGFGYNIYPIKAGWYKPETVTTQEIAGGVTLTKTEKYSYNIEGSVKSVKVFNSKGDSLVTRYYYPNDNMINNTVDNYMTTKHNTGMPVITEHYRGNTFLSRQKTVYGSFPTISTLLPQYIYNTKGSIEEKRVTFNSYDDRGNVTQYTEENNMPVSFVWNADKTLPVAKVENAAYASLQALPGGLNADFRTLLPDARVTTYTYKPLIGVSTITDASNRVSTYEYDAFGRLLLVKDHDGNIIKTFEYHYKQ